MISRPVATVLVAHRRLVDAIARATGLTGEPFPNRPLRNRPLRSPQDHRRHAPVAGHGPSRRRVLLGMQARIDALVRGSGR